MFMNQLDTIIKFCYEQIESGGDMTAYYSVMNKCDELKNGTSLSDDQVSKLVKKNELLIACQDPKEFDKIIDKHRSL